MRPLGSPTQNLDRVYAVRFGPLIGIAWGVWDIYELVVGVHRWTTAILKVVAMHTSSLDWKRVVIIVNIVMFIAIASISVYFIVVIVTDITLDCRLEMWRLEPRCASTINFIEPSL
jgi:hypothetical protein